MLHVRACMNEHHTRNPRVLPACESSAEKGHDISGGSVANNGLVE
jgi:hypothetical protein